MNRISFISGLIGGSLVLFIGILILLSINTFNYSIKIINPRTIDKVEKYSNKRLLIQEMESEGILLTPYEYTNNVINHYNTAITILGAMLIIFSALGYFHLRFISQENLKKTIDNYFKSKEFSDSINTSVFGKADDKFVTTEAFQSILDLTKKLSKDVSELKQEELKEETVEIKK